MNLVSQLAAVIFSLAFTETSQKSGDMAESGQKLTLHEYLICYISQKTALNFIMILSTPSRQHFLSLEHCQPFGCNGFLAWHS